MAQSPKSIAIVGAGVIGLAMARACAREGYDVSAFDKGAIGRASSWAAAGMLAAGAETHPGEETFYALARASRDMWPDFAAELERDAAMGIGYCRGETFVIAQSDGEEQELRDTFAHLKSLGEPARLIQNPSEFDPAIARDARLGLLSPHDGQVDNRLLTDALVRAAEQAGARLRDATEVQDIWVDDRGARGLVVDDQRVAFDHVILAAGAWSSTAFPSIRGKVPDLSPVKGQMLALAHRPAALQRITWGQGVYIVPRADGRVIIGATTEHVGFDVSIDRAVIERQKRKAVKVVPGLADADVCETWAGLRPASSDGLPLLGPSAIEGLTLATGHYRNGILLTPITISLLVEFLATGEIPAALVPFIPARLRETEKSHA